MFKSARPYTWVFFRSLIYSVLQQLKSRECEGLLVHSVSCHTVPSVQDMSMLSTNIKLQSHVTAKPMQRLGACDSVQSSDILTCIFLLLHCNRPGIYLLFICAYCKLISVISFLPMEASRLKFCCGFNSLC